VAIVLFSSTQQRLTNGEERVEVEASRVDELIQALYARYADLDGQLENAAVAVDGVIYNEALYVPLPATAEVQFVGQVAGGSGDAVAEPLGGVAGEPLRLARAWRDEGRGVALATVVETWGSSPCPAGSQLAIDAAGHFEGSVSGGCVEGAVIERATHVISSGEPELLEFGVADEDAWAVGLACGGRVQIYVERVE
jgi:molybdopterin converting factor small subunit